MDTMDGEVSWKQWSDQKSEYTQPMALRFATQPYYISLAMQYQVETTTLDNKSCVYQAKPDHWWLGTGVLVTLLLHV